jgi:hypothetical protein
MLQIVNTYAEIATDDDIKRTAKRFPQPKLHPKLKKLGSRPTHQISKWPVKLYQICMQMT